MSLLQSWWHNKKISGDAATLSDIMFLVKKEFDGKLIHLNSTSDETTTGVKLTRTIPNGKTFYLASAKIIPMNTPASSSSTDWRATVAIKFDGTIVDTIGTLDTQNKTQVKVPVWELRALVWSQLKWGYRWMVTDQKKLKLI